MIRVIVPAAILSAALLVAAPPAPAVSPRADAVDLLITGGDKPARVEIRVAIDGKPAPAVWDETFAKLHAFYDRNGDGTLDKTEAARLPSALLLRQVLWGRFITENVGPPPFASLDLDANGKVGRDELADFYRREGIGSAVVGVGTAPGTGRLTDAILARLDADKDGTVSEAEWKAAESLRKLDANDDELVSPGELVEHLVYPGARGANLLAAGERTSLPLVLLPLRTHDTRWADSAAVSAKGTTSEQLLALRKSPAAASWPVSLGGRKPAEGDAAEATARPAFASGTLRVELAVDAGKGKELTSAGRDSFTRLFADADSNNDGRIDAEELAGPKALALKQLAASADRDGDGRLDRKEFAAWLDLQEQIAKGHAFVTVLDFGAGLFELLDADGDGALSLRELRGAAARVKSAGCLGPKGLDRARLPRRLLAVVSHGLPARPMPEPVRRGPAWFRAMDRNRDGDVSLKEWVGELDVFRKLDADSDGLLSPAEAAKGAPK